MKLKQIVPCLCLATLLYSGLAFAAADKFILLPNEDGTTGAILITTSRGSQLLQQAYSIVKVDESGNLILLKSNVFCVDVKFDPAVLAMPKPKDFTLTIPGQDATLDAEAQNIMNAILAQIASTQMPFITISGHQKLVNLVNSLLLQSKIPNLTILLDVLPVTDAASHSQTVNIRVY